MKLPLPLLLSLVVSSLIVQGAAWAQQIAITTISSDQVCPGSPISVSYTHSANDFGGIYLYLNGPGMTDLPLSVSTSSGGDGSITGTIPADRTAGLYTVRLYRYNGMNVISSPNSSTFAVGLLAPTGKAVDYCLNTAAVALTATGQNLKWYTSPTGGTGVTTLVPSTTAVGSSNYYVSYISAIGGCESPRAPVAVTIKALPSVQLTNNGPLSPALSSVTLTASGGVNYLFSPGATQIGNNPTATVSAPGIYSVFVTANTGCSNVASTTVTQALIADLSPQLYARPTSVYGTSPVTVVVDVMELNGVSSAGLITLKITQDPQLNLSLPPDATTIDNRPVNNRVWQLSSPSEGYYTLSTNQVVAAGGTLSVGLTATLTSAGNSGALTVSGLLVGGSGGEQKLLNNTASARIEYFQH